MFSNRKTVLISPNLYNLIRPIINLGRFYGLLPIAWRKCGENYIFTKSFTAICYSYCFVVFFVFMSAYGLIQLSQIDVVYSVRFKENTGRYVTISDICVVLLFGLLGVVITSTNINKFIEFLECLQQIDSNLPAKKQEKSNKYYIVTVLTMLLSIMILIFDCFMWTKISMPSYQNMYLLLSYYVPYYFSYLFTIVMELIYWNCVHLIKTRMIVLNDYLNDIIYQQNVKQQFQKLCKREQIGNVVDNLMLAKQSSQQTFKNNKSITADSVRNLISAYSKILEAKNIVNEFYGLIILIVILGCLIHLLVTPYALYSIIYNTGQTMFVISQTIWMIGHIFRLILLVEPCHDCNAQSKIAIETICKLLTSNLMKETRKELQIFALNLAQCKMQFTACDLTEINRTLLTAIAGAVTTYLVILFQFNKVD